MPVVLDTSILVGAIHAGDDDHALCRRTLEAILAGSHGAPVTCDYVLDEGLTLLMRRTGNPAVCREYAALFMGGDAGEPPLLPVREVTGHDLVRATKFFFRHFDRRLSFTDCVLIALADELGAPIASIDDDFDGIVPRIP